MKILYSILLIFISQSMIYGQTFHIYDVETDNYPLLKAKFFVTDNDNVQIKSLVPAEFTIFENQVERFVRDIECDDEPAFNRISTILTIDVSGSMNGTRLDWVKSAGKQWIEQMDSLNEETAITTFDDEALLYSDFKINKTLLLSSLASLEIRNGTNYKNAFLDPYAGALDVARRAEYKPVIIFLTDGVGLSDFKTSDVIQTAENLGAIIYAISIDIALPEEMRIVSEATGGQYFENIDSQEKLEEVYNLIRQVAINTSPCEISWYTEGCLLGRQAEFKYIPLNLKKNISFDTPGDVFPEFEYINDQFASFECNKPSEYIYKLKAKNGEIIVNGVFKKSGNESCSDFSVNIMNRNLPFNLQKDSVLEIRVRYTPSNNNYKFCEFEIDASTCLNNELYAVGNCLDSPPTNILLNVKKPNGGEVLKANTIERVLWNGSSKDNDLIVEYSLDSGNSWSFINNGKLYNNTKWNVPNIESNNCLIKVKQMSSDAGRKIYETSIDSSNVLGISWNNRGNLFAIVTGSNSIKLFNSITGQKVDEIIHLTDNSTIKDVRFLPDGARIYVSNENGLYLLNLLNKKFEFIDSLSGKLEISNDESIMVITNSDSVVVFDIQTKKKVKIINKNMPNDIITDAAISNDSKRIAVSDSTDDEENFIRIFDKSTNWTITTDITLNDPGLDYSYSNIDWSFDDEFLFSTSWVNNTHFLDLWDLTAKEKIVRMVEPSTSKISDLKSSHKDNILVQVDRGFKIKVLELEKVDDKYQFNELYEFTSSVLRNNTIEWSPDGSRFAVGTSGSNTAKLLSVYSVKSYPTVEDISDSTFSIVKNVFDIESINLGTALIGQTKDSTFSNIIQYKYNYPFIVDSVKFNGFDENAFSISNTPNLPATANSISQPIFNFSFTPFKVGEHNTNMSLYTQFGIKTVKILASGVKPLIGIENYNFGEVLVTKDSSITKESITNNGSSNLIINNIRIVGPSDEYYSITDDNNINIEEIKDIILSPNEKYNLNIKFSPLFPEILNARVEIEYINEFNNTDYKYIKLYGEGIKPELGYLENISFKSTQCNEISTEEITIYNNGKGSLILSNIILNSLNFKLLDNFNFDLVLGEKDSLKFRIEFDAFDSGILKDSLLIFTNQLNKPLHKIYLNGRKLNTSFKVEGNNRLIGVDDNVQINDIFQVINNGKTDLNWSTPYISPNGNIEILSVEPNPTLQGDTSIVKYRFNGGEKGEIFSYLFAPEPICSDSIQVVIEVKNTNPTLSTDFENLYNIVCEDSLLIKIPITNIGEEDLVISNIRFENDDSDKFKTATKNLTLSESESDTILIYFSSEVQGLFTTDFVIISNDSKSTQGRYSKRITIKKEISKFNIIENSIDFQFIGLNNPGNKTFEILNEGTLPIRWNWLPLNDFNIISIVPPIAEPGEKSIVTLNYDGPNDINSYNNLFVSDSCGNLDSIMLNVLSSNTASAIVSLSNEKRKIGEVFDYKLQLKNATKLVDAGVTSITGELVFNHSLMIPKISNSTINNQTRNVPFEITNLESGSTTNVTMEALWGNDSCSIVSIRNLEAKGNTSQISLEQEVGEICISDLCYEGGIRLIDLSVELGANIKLNNNQNNILEIELSIIERGNTEINIIDVNGKIIQTISKNNLDIGNNYIYTDISDIADGVYFIEINTTSISLYDKLIIIR